MREHSAGLTLPRFRLPFSFLVSWWGLIFFVALSVRLAFLATKPLAWHHQLRAGDEPLYHGIAVSLAHGIGYSVDGQPTARYGPGYPFFVASVYRVAGIRPPAVRLANALLSSLLCLLVAFGAAQVWGKRAGIGAGLFCAFYYPFVQLPLYLMTENLYLPLFVAATAMTWRLKTSPETVRAIGAGFLWGVAALTRSLALPITFLVALWVGLRQWRYAGIMLVVALLTLVPWTVRNYLVFRAFIPLQLSAGHDFYLAFGPAGDEPKVLGHWNWGSHVARPKVPVGLSPVERDRWLKEQALAYIRANPMEAVVKRIPRKLANLLVPFYGTASLPNKVLTSLCYLLLLALSLPAWWQAWHSQNLAERRLAELVLSIAAFTLAFHAVFYGVVRYRYPIDALLLVFTGKTLARGAQGKEQGAGG